MDLFKLPEQTREHVVTLPPTVVYGSPEAEATIRGFCEAAIKDMLVPVRIVPSRHDSSLVLVTLRPLTLMEVHRLLADGTSEEVGVFVQRPRKTGKTRLLAWIKRLGRRK